MGEPRPDLIVGIDLGMTCTGVAYANPSIGSETIRWIQRWPGRMQANENKVPTILIYPSNQTTPSSWGYLADMNTAQMSDGIEHREWFKTFLDEGVLQQARASRPDGSGVPSSIEEVERLYTDYFRLIYQHTQSKLQNELASRWEDARIEFIFSVPTTWKPHPTVERFRKVVERAGIGCSPNHKIVIGLTEAEAAAVHTAKESPGIFKERDVLLVCDIGGGTTDLSALRVTGVMSGSLSLEQIDVVFGANVGAAGIDRAFEAMMLQRLQAANASIPLGIDVEDAAWDIMKSKEYQNAKCEFGVPNLTPQFTIAIPKLSRTYNNPVHGIMDGELVIARNDLQQLFEVQVEALFRLLDEQLQRLQQKIPHEQVSHLVVSGGLGNSAYIQSRLRGRYASGMAVFPNASRIQFRVAQDPQLVVCKGIVADRLAKLQSGKSVLGWRCCRASYGTVCRMLYNPQNPAHLGQQTVRDPVDNKLYIPNVVDWFIKQGEPVSIDYPIVRLFRQRFTPQNPYRVFPTAIVVSHVDKELLPFTMNQNCSKLCDVQSDFSSVALTNFKLKNRHFWNFGAKYYRADYCVKVALGPADIQFELWHKGQKLSKDNPIKVEWHAAAAPVNQPAPMPNPMHFQPMGQGWSNGFGAPGQGMPMRMDGPGRFPGAMPV